MPETETTVASDDIRSMLASALTEQETPEPVVVKEPEPAEPAENVEAKEPEAKEPEATEVKEPEAKEEKTEAKEPKEGDKLEPPSNWSKRDKEMFARTSDPDVKKWLIDRNKSMEADYTKKTQAVAQLKKEYEPVDQLFAPHRNIMKEKGFSPETLVKAWMNVEQQLATSPESGVEVIKGLIAGYKIPVDKVAAALGINKAAPQQQQVEQANDPQAAAQAPQQLQLPPELQAKLAKLDQLESWQQRQEREKAETLARSKSESEARTQRAIDEFKEETDGKGNLLHPYFETVEQEMVQLALAIQAGGKPVPPLKDLYEMAVHANPDTREKFLTAQRQQEEQKRAAEARAKAANAKKAGSSVTGSPSGTGHAPNRTGDLSLRQQLEEAANEAA